MIDPVTVGAGAATAVGMVSKVAVAVAQRVDLNRVRSLTDISKPSRVEPIVVVDDLLAGEPATVDILRSLLSLFSAYYTMGVQNYGDTRRIEALKVLDQFNPQRVGMKDRVLTSVTGNEAYDEGLPGIESFDNRLHLVAGLEADAVTVNDKDVKRGLDGDNLSVGKLLCVEFQPTGSDKPINMYVSVRLIPAILRGETILHIFAGVAASPMTMKERYHAWRSGQITFFRDLILCRDLVKEHRKALVNDNSNIYKTISDRATTNAIAANVTDQPSLGTASNMLVIDKSTAVAIERKLGGKLSSSSMRAKFFGATNLLFLAVVDTKYSRVKIYHDGLELPTEATFADIKSSEKGKGPDITELLKAMMSGTTPSI